MSDTDTSKPDHLCVMIHGLWGNPEHLKYLSESLQEHVGDDKIDILICKSNSGNFTYDGIDVGAERSATEIKDYIKAQEEKGHHYTKFSIVGYSLGGLVARFLLGLLDHDGVFDKAKPINFTTFATPHLGARTPLSLWTSHIYNALSPHLISASGQQMFSMDNFRDSGRPLLEVLADPDSIFMRALAKFERRSIYANIYNDRLAPFYTTAISSTDPYANANIKDLRPNYIKGFRPILIDGNNPFNESDAASIASTTGSLPHGQSAFRRVATAAGFVFFAPIVLTGFLATTTVESLRSHRRIQEHVADADRSAGYRIPNMLKRLTSTMEEKANAASDTSAGAVAAAALDEEVDEIQEAQMFTQEKSTDDKSTLKGLPKLDSTSTSSSEKSSIQSEEQRKPSSSAGTSISSESRRMSSSSSTSKSEKTTKDTLALLPGQFEMIKNLDNLGLEKFHVHMSGTHWTHAAIVVRRNTSMFDEGKQVVRHWLERQFIV